MQHVSDLRSKFTLRPHHVWKYGEHQICTQLRLGEEKRGKKKKKKKPQSKNIMSASAMQGGHNYHFAPSMGGAVV